MIDFFNRLGNSWIAKIICSALALSMIGLWGLGGFSNNMTGSDNKAAIVGDTVITVTELNQVFNREKNKLSALTGQYISPKKAIEIGLLDKVVQQLVAEKLSEQISDEIGLIASDESVRKYVERNPVFQDKLGKFDTNLFYAYLGQMKISQAELAEQMKMELARQHLSNTLLKAVPRDNQLMEIAAKTQKEKRQITALLLKNSDIPVKSADEQTLKDYYEAYQDEFTTPEYRKIRLLALMPEHFKNDYDKLYQAQKDLEDALGEGTPLQEAAQKLHLQNSILLTVDIAGKNTQGKLADPKLEKNPILQEIFTLSDKEATSLTEYNNGFLVAEVEEVIPVAFKPYETVKAQVQNLYRSEQQKESFSKVLDSLTEQVAARKGWGKYQPQTLTLERESTKVIPAELLTLIFAQKIGVQEIKTYPADNGTWLIVVDKVIQSEEKVSQKEKSDAVSLWANDLAQATNQSYTQRFKLQINQDTIQKAFSAYMKEED